MEDTTARQNKIIWSAATGLILILLGVIGWLINGKDNQILTSIKEVRNSQEAAIIRTEQSDQKILESINKLCERVGGVEGRVSNLEIFIQMPFNQRKDLFESFKNPNSHKSVPR